MPTGIYERTPEHGAKISAAKMGHSVSDETRAKISAATRLTMTPERRSQISASLLGRSLSEEHRAKIISVIQDSRVPSKLAWKAYELLLKDFDVVVPEASFGHYSVDFLLAEEWIGIEVDGEYWHKDRDHTERDAYLLREHGLPIVRLSERELKEMGGY